MVALISARQLLDRPGRIGAPRVIDGEDPFAVLQAAHDLHGVVMDFDGLAASVGARDPPL
jgi:hypothetical protein